MSETFQLTLTDEQVMTIVVALELLLKASEKDPNNHNMIHNVREIQDLINKVVWQEEYKL